MMKERIVKGMKMKAANADEEKWLEAWGVFVGVGRHSDGIVGRNFTGRRQHSDPEG